jgi:DNA helicase-2/ATP-dependent DNA helicase PcrA
MPSLNKVVIASAGSGKSTGITRQALADSSKRAVLITYTNNNAEQIGRHFYAAVGHIPKHVHVSSWFAFLLRHLVRPYQRALVNKHVDRLNFNQGESALYSKQSDILRHYFDSSGAIYRDKVSKFVCEVNKQTSGKPIERLEKIFDSLYIDEVQDIAGFDLELVELFLKSSITITLVGDIRQATFTTHNARKNRQYGKDKIIDRFLLWEAESLCEIKYQNVSHRCVQAICDFADRLYPSHPKTQSLNTAVTDHDGIFAVRKKDIPAYMVRYSPQTLRYDRRTVDVPGKPMNYGVSKGLTFERTLIFPTTKIAKFLLTGNPAHAGTLPKFYVAITRARQSTAFVIADNAKSPLMPIFEE